MVDAAMGNFSFPYSTTTVLYETTAPNDTTTPHAQTDTTVFFTIPFPVANQAHVMTLQRPTNVDAKREIIAEVELSKRAHVRETAQEHKKRLQVSDHMGREWKFLGQPGNFTWERKGLDSPPPDVGSVVPGQRGEREENVQTRQDTGGDGPPTIPPLRLIPLRDSPPTSSIENGTENPPHGLGQPIETKTPPGPPSSFVNEPKAVKQEPASSSDLDSERVNDKATQTRKAASELESQPQHKRLVDETHEPPKEKHPFGIVRHRGIHFLVEDLGGLVHLYSCGVGTMVFLFPDIWAQMVSWSNQGPGPM